MVRPNKRVILNSKMFRKLYYLNKETINDFIWRSLQISGKGGITFLIFILCAKLLTPYYFGIYNYALAIIFFLILFGDFGISTATSKYVAEYNITDKNKLKLVLFNSGLIIIALTIIITIITLIIGPWYLKDNYTYVLWLLPIVFLAPMTSLYDGIYRGLKRFKQLAIISIIAGLFSLTFVYFLIKQYGLVGALIAQNLFYLILLISLGLGYRKFSLGWNKAVMKEVGRYSFVIGITTVGYYLFSRVGVIILGQYNYINEIAVYELLNKIFTLGLLPFTILGTVISPKITELYAKKNYGIILSKFKRYFIILLPVATIISVFSYLLLPKIIFTFFNEYYNSILFTIIIPVIIIYGIQFYCAIINSGLIVSTGHANITAYLNIILGVFNIFLSLFLLNYLGFIGIIYSILILNLIGVIVLHSIYYIKIKDLVSKNETKE